MSTADRGNGGGHDDDGARRAGPGGVLELPLVVLDEVIRVVPRLVDRTRSQVELARRIGGHVPCLGALFTHRVDAPMPAHEAPQPVDVLAVVARDGDDEDDGSGHRGGRPAGRNGAAVTPDPTATGAVPPAGEPGPPAPAEEELAVPDYDSLAASQVVPRLAALSADELDAVRRYEEAHRRRQTILNRVAQLLAD
jgi:hypothetical protein